MAIAETETGQRDGPNGVSNGAADGAAEGRFTSIPILNLDQARNPKTKPEFLSELRDALLQVGFCYISQTGLPPELVQQVKDETFKFFNEDVLPFPEKEKIEMKNEKSFLGWSRVSPSPVVSYSNRLRMRADCLARTYDIGITHY